jgi:hypothetical protein
MKVGDRFRLASTERLEAEETGFVSIADFFSLLSISFIYFAVSFGSPISSNATLKIESAAESGAGPASPIDSTIVNVSLLFSKSRGAIVRVIAPTGQQSDLNVREVQDPLLKVPQWVVERLAGFEGVKYVVLYMAVDGADLEAFKLRDRIGNVLSNDYEVRLVF